MKDKNPHFFIFQLEFRGVNTLVFLIEWQICLIDGRVRQGWQSMTLLL
jgi:hypothetical protein